METDESEASEAPPSPVRRPMNAFLIFCKRHRTIIRNKNPNMDNRNVTRILGELWAKLPADEKKVYTDLAQQYKVAFMKANPDYKWYNPDKSTQPSKPMTRPSNSARHVTMTARKYGRNGEEAIKPGKLADPTEMGGLNLLLMAGQEALTSPRSVVHRDECLDTCNGNSQIVDSSHQVEQPSTAEMASIVTSQIAAEQVQKADDTISHASGQQVVDHVIDQLYFSQRCRVNSGDSVNNNGQSRTSAPDSQPLGPVEQPKLALATGYSPKKEFQYRWRSMSASGQLESFKRFQASNLTRSHEMQDFREVKTTVLPGGGGVEGMEVEGDGDGTWKSPRSNRGQRYKEMMSEGLLQTQAKQNSSESDEEASNLDGDFLPDTKKAAARKRTVSEAENNAKLATTDKRYKTGDFDLDAEIASLTPCAVDSVCKKRSGRQLNRMRHHSEGSKRQPNFTFDKIFTVGELHGDRLLCSPVPGETTTNLVGSQRRKARKSSITHLIQVSSLENLSVMPSPPPPPPPTEKDSDSNGCQSTRIDGSVPTNTYGRCGLQTNAGDIETVKQESLANLAPGKQASQSISFPTLSEITRTKVSDLGLSIQPSSQLCLV